MFLTFFRFGSLFASNGLVMKYPMRDILARYGPSDFSAAAVAGAASAAVAAASATVAADKAKICDLLSCNLLWGQ